MFNVLRYHLFCTESLRDTFPLYPAHGWVVSPYTARGYGVSPRCVWSAETSSEKQANLLWWSDITYIFSRLVVNRFEGEHWKFLCGSSSVMWEYANHVDTIFFFHSFSPEQWHLAAESAHTSTLKLLMRTLQRHNFWNNEQNRVVENLVEWRKGLALHVFCCVEMTIMNQFAGFMWKFVNE